MEKDYFVPFADFGEDKFEEKRSKFTGRLWHVETAEQAVAKIKEMRETFWDATHNCYAYILREGNVMRYSDDGEPQGTAGMPILEVLTNKKLFETAVVVTRYFGGIKLGAGGLVRAYAGTAAEALAQADIREYRVCRTLFASVGYEQFDALKKFLAARGCEPADIAYAGDVTVTLSVGEEEAAAFSAALVDFLAGRVRIREGGAQWAAFAR